MNLQQLAATLGVSKTTVSRALAGYPDVSPVTRERVREAAERYRYRPSATARRLASGRVEAVGLILPTGPGHFDDPFFLALMTGMSERLARADLDLLVTTAERGPGEMRALERLVEHKRVDAMVVARTRRHDPRVSYLLDRGFPFICHGRVEEVRPYAYLDTDGAAAFAAAVDRLAGLGHERIGFIGGPADLFHVADRLRGFRAGMASRGLPVEDDFVRIGADDDLHGAAIAAALLSRSTPPTALLCTTDGLAMAAVQAAREKGLRVPGDLSVIGFDDLPPGRLFLPPLTTMGQSVAEAGRHIAGLLLRLLGGASAGELQETWPVHLIVRGSDGPPT